MSTFNTMIKTTLTPMALCLTLAIATPALAQKGHHHHHEGMRQILSELSLTDTQKQDIRQLLKQSREDRDLFSGDAQLLTTELHNLVQSTEWDQTAVESAITQHQALHQEKALQRASNKNKVWNLLTGSQQSELAAQLETHKNKGDERHKAANRKGKHNGYTLKNLDLTEEQLTAIKAIKNGAKTSAEVVKGKLKTFKQAEQALIHSADFAPDAWQALSHQHQADFLAMAMINAKRKHDIWNLLTPEQQAVAAADKRKQEHNAQTHQN